MKKKHIVLIAVGIVVIGCVITGFSVFLGIEASLEELSNTKIANIDLGTIEDGDYTGSYDAVAVMVKVSVTIKNHRITRIDLIEHNNGKGQPAEIITQSIVDAQRLDVDVISGATLSSKAILKAVENALTGAE